MILDAGLQVSSLCRGGFFTGPDATVDENLRALEEAAELGAPTLVLVCGAPRRATSPQRAPRLPPESSGSFRTRSRAASGSESSLSTR